MPAGLLHLGFGHTLIASIPSLPVGLKYLDCSYCSHLHNLPTLPVTLTDLYCNNDSLTTLTFPSGIGNMNNIYCNNNQLTSIVNLPTKVTTLWAYDNQLTTLPSMPNVQGLGLAYNNISSLPYYNSQKQFPDSLMHINIQNNNFWQRYTKLHKINLELCKQLLIFVA